MVRPKIYPEKYCGTCKWNSPGRKCGLTGERQDEELFWEGCEHWVDWMAKSWPRDDR